MHKREVIVNYGEMNTHCTHAQPYEISLRK